MMALKSCSGNARVSAAVRGRARRVAVLAQAPKTETKATQEKGLADKLGKVARDLNGLGDGLGPIGLTISTSAKVCCCPGVETLPVNHWADAASKLHSKAASLDAPPTGAG